MSSPSDRRSAEFWIKHLDLVEHPGEEDGFFSDKVFRDPFTVTGISGQPRNAATIAYFLQKSAPPLSPETMFFKCQSSEMIFYHAGDPMTVYIMPESGSGDFERVVIGPEVDKGQVLAFAVPKRRWFTRLVEGQDKFTVFSCSLAPGFDIEDFDAKLMKKLRN